MKKTITVTLGSLVLVVLGLMAIPTTRDEIHWHWALHKDDSNSYESYLKVWPEGRHAVDARAIYDERSWARAITANTVEDFEHYLQLHGDGKYIIEAKNNIDSLDWHKASTDNTIESYKTYISRHSQGSYIQQAQTKTSSLRTSLVTKLMKDLDNYSQNEHFRSNAAKQLGKIQDSTAIPALIATLKNDREMVRNSAVEALGDIGVVSIEPLLATSNLAKIKDYVPKVLVKIGEPSVAYVISYLKHKDDTIRWIAVKSLKDMRFNGAAELLLELLQKETSELVQCAISEALGELGDAHAADALITAFINSKSAGEPGKIRVSWENSYDCTCAALLKLKITDTRIFDRLSADLNNSDHSVRENAAKNLGKFKDPRAIDPLIETLKDQDYMVKYQTVGALGSMGDKKAIYPLLSSLAGVSAIHTMGDKVADALAQIGEPAIEPLIVLLSDEKPILRLVAARALTKMNYNGATEYYLASSSDPYIVCGAYKFFIGLNTDSSDMALIKALDLCNSIYMAEDYLKSNRVLLRSKAVEWGKAHGYTVLETIK
jgi:HEAT repeat protein